MTITGSGTQADPYILYTGEDFEQLKLSLSAYFKLNNDVDFNGLLYTPPLDFGGVFDGNGKKIKNLTTGNGSNYSSLFGRTTSMFSVKNLGVENVTINGGLYTGALVGHNVGGLIEKCFVLSGVVNGSSQIGGLVGFNQGGTVSDCYSRATVIASGTSRIGSLVGRSSGTIVNSYGAGFVDSSYLNAGLNGEGTNVNSSYWDIEITGKSASAGGVGLTTAQMKTQSSFVGWDFLTIWGIDATNNNGYPYLKSFIAVEPPTGQAYTKTVTDAITAADTISSKKLSRFKMLADAVTLAENIIKRAASYKTFTEYITISDTMSRAKKIVMALFDAVGASENFNDEADFKRSLPDSITATDALNKAVAVRRILTDAITQTDNLTAQFIPYIPDANNYTKLLTEAIYITDSIIRSITKVKSDTVTTSDTMAKLAAKTKADAITLSEVNSKRIGRRISDSTGVTDAANKQAAKTKMDMVSLSDSMSKRMVIAVADTVNLGDSSQTSSQGSQTKALIDMVLITDAIVKKVISISKADAVNIGEVDSQAINKRIMDQITATDSITKSKGKAIILTDAVTVTDALFKAANILKSDSIAMDDNTSKRANYSLKLYDVVIVTDTMQTYLPNAPELIGRIRVNGANLNVYITGKHEAQINISGKNDGEINIKGAIE